jgi:hypothetical protein
MIDVAAARQCLPRLISLSGTDPYPGTPHVGETGPIWSTLQLISLLPGHRLAGTDVRCLDLGPGTVPLDGFTRTVRW